MTEICKGHGPAHRENILRALTTLSQSLPATCNYRACKKGWSRLCILGTVTSKFIESVSHQDSCLKVVEICRSLRTKRMRKVKTQAGWFSLLLIPARVLANNSGRLLYWTLPIQRSIRSHTYTWTSVWHKLCFEKKRLAAWASSNFRTQEHETHNAEANSLTDKYAF